MIHTSNFASVGRLFPAERGVAISRTVPDWYSGRRCLELAPSEKLLAGYKDGLVTVSEYKRVYIKQLGRLGSPTDVVNRIIAKFGDDAILLCYESVSKFCHRHVLAEWLDCGVKEFGIPKGLF